MENFNLSKTYFSLVNFYFHLNKIFSSLTFQLKNINVKSKLFILQYEISTSNNSYFNISIINI